MGGRHVVRRLMAVAFFVYIARFAASGDTDGLQPGFPRRPRAPTRGEVKGSFLGPVMLVIDDGTIQL